MQCAYSITIFLKDIQELFARIWEKSLQLSYLYMSLSSGVQCIVRFYVSTLLTRVVLFWHFNTQNLQDKQNFSHALRICCSFLAKALKPKTLLWWWFFGSPTIFKCSDIFLEFFKSFMGKKYRYTIKGCRQKQNLDWLTFDISWFPKYNFLFISFETGVYWKVLLLFFSFPITP